MNYKFSSIITLILMLSVLYSKAQSNNSDFILTSGLITVSGVDVTIASTLTKSGNTITWLEEANNGNSDTTIFNINDNTGSWDEINSTGTLTYNLNDSGYSYSMILKGDVSGVTATLTYHKNETEQKAYIFHISSINYQ